MEIRYLFFLSSYYIRDLYYNFFFKFEQIKWILQQEYVFSQLVDIFNLSVTTGIFHTNLKTAKVFPVDKKNQNLTFQTKDLYHSYLIPTKYLKNVCIIADFLEK